MHLVRFNALWAFFLLGALNAGDDTAVWKPWIPTAVDDWNALRAEAESYRVALAKQQPQLPAPRATPGPMMVVAERLPPLPAGLPAADVFILNYWLERGQSRVALGSTVVLRANGAGVAEVHTAVRYDIVPSGQADESVAHAAATACTATIMATPGNWQATRDGSWCKATWRRAQGAIRTLDDAHGRAPELTANDLAWLRGPPALRPIQPAAAVADATEAQAAAHPGVQRTLALHQAGVTARSLLVYKIEPDTSAARLGVQVGDRITAIDGRPVLRAADVGKLDGTVSHVVTIARLGARPRQVTFPIDNWGMSLSTAAPDPALAVVSAAGGDAPMARDIAAAIHAFDQPGVAESARRRVTPRLLPAAARFVEAWSVADDPARADALLEGMPADAPADLLGESRVLRAALRERSGRFIWAWPDRWADPGVEVMLRHLLQGVDPAERFGLLDGVIATARFSTPADGVGASGMLTSILADREGELALPAGRIAGEGALTDLPERIQITANIAMQPAPEAKRFDLDSALIVGFRVSTPRLTTGQGCGALLLAADGKIFTRTATLTNDSLPQLAQPLPGGIVGPSMTSLRVVRIGPMQRIEIGGRLAMQGFLPLPADGRLSLVFSCRPETRLRITDLRLMTMPAPPTPSGF